MYKRYAVAVLVLATCYLSPATDIDATATFMRPPYTPYDCPDEPDRGNLIVGVSTSLWNDGANCGKKMRVWCTGILPTGIRPAGQMPICQDASVDVFIVKHYEEGDDGAICLSVDAYDLISFHDHNITVKYQMPVV